VTNKKLQSLAPSYNSRSHATYVRHLTEALTDIKNRNIALTGRYGAGKSSVLDQFASEQLADHKKVLRISINTLGPDDDDDITNRIQKELVKQLIYRAAPGAVTRARFARPAGLTPVRLISEAAGITLLLVGLLWLFKVRPDPTSFGDWPEFLPLTAFAALVFGAAATVRWAIGNKLISQISTAGTSIQLEKQPDSYFDEYLDETVAFFEATEPDIVIFEDLDRFDDPRIFDSLRELNTLLNASAHWAARPERPIRFVYAIKDSLFEKLGEIQDDKDEASGLKDAEHTAELGESDTTSGTKNRKDPAEAALERANRTKFFEIVIPMVSFLSHSNARDLLDAALIRLELSKEDSISRPLLDLVSRHTTDMRLMINMVNEFVVYAEALLWIKNKAPGIDADALFALVAYKNFHLADFEALPHRGSALDRLESRRRLLVRESIESLQRQRTSLLNGDTMKGEQSEVAQALNTRLQLILTATKHTPEIYTLDGSFVDRTTTTETEFWELVSRSKVLNISARTHRGTTQEIQFERHLLQDLFPEAFEDGRWSSLSYSDATARRKQIDTEIATLRGAGFSFLGKNPQYVSGGKPFKAYSATILGSSFANELVSQGFITRYYAEYSALFYGDFVGVDVANYYRNTVLPNGIDIYAHFDSEESIKNIIEQSPDDFTRSRSVLNLEVVNYMLTKKTSLANEVVLFITSENYAEQIDFLTAFFSTPDLSHELLAQNLSQQRWSDLLIFISRPDLTFDPSMREKLLDVVLLSIDDELYFRISPDLVDLFKESYMRLSAFTDEQNERRTDIVYRIAERVELWIDNLEYVSPSMVQKFVASKQYELTAQNLRVALLLEESDALGVERLRASPEVWQYVKQSGDIYLDVAANDDTTPFAIWESETLVDTLNEVADEWPAANINRLLSMTSADVSVIDISTMVPRLWQMIAENDLMLLSISNLVSYTETKGIDGPLITALIDSSGEVKDFADKQIDEPERVQQLIAKVLNSGDQLLAEQRVSIVLGLTAIQGEIRLKDIIPTDDVLLSKLLEAELVADSEEVFMHFSAGGWRAMRSALRVSENAKTFISPELVLENGAELLSDDRIPIATKRAVLARLEAYVPQNSDAFLAYAAHLASSVGARLSKAQIKLVAPMAQYPEDILSQLAISKGTMSGIDIMSVLASMGGEYAGFAQGPGSKFELQKTNSLNAVLTQLKDDNYIQLPTGGRVDRRRVIMV
jgi:hypothetical protein